MKRGYKRLALLKIATEVSKIDRATLLEYKHRKIWTYTFSTHLPLPNSKYLQSNPFFIFYCC